MNLKALSWLLFAIVLLLTPVLFAVVAVFPILGNNQLFQMVVLVMFIAFAASFWILFKKSQKLSSKNYIWIAAFLAGLLVPLWFANAYILPMFALYYQILYIFMHLVFSAGVIIALSQWSKIKKLV